MWHSIVVDDKFFAEIEEEDGRVAARVQAAGCPHCQGRLDRADYPRKPRGGDLAPAGERLSRRISLCCARDGCRRRATPPSLIFLGRRIYLGVVVLVASILAARSPAERRPASTSPPAKAVKRWLAWFRDILPTTTLFTAARGRLWPPIEDRATLPEALVERMRAGRTVVAALVATVRLLAPLTTNSVHDGARFVMDLP